MSAKRGRIPAVGSTLIDDEILRFKNQLYDVLNTKKTDGKCKYNITIVVNYN